MASLTCIDLGRSAEELNSAIESCTSTYLAFVEEGATYADSYFEQLAQELDAHPEAAFAKGVMMRGEERLTLDRWAKDDPKVVDFSKD